MEVWLESSCRQVGLAGNHSGQCCKDMNSTCVYDSLWHAVGVADRKIANNHKSCINPQHTVLGYCAGGMDVYKHSSLSESDLNNIIVTILEHGAQWFLPRNVKGCQKRKVGGVRYEARSCGRSSPDWFGFLSLRNPQTIEPTTAWIAVPAPSASTRYSFFYTCVKWGALYGRTLVRARPNGQYQRTGPPSNVD